MKKLIEFIKEFDSKNQKTAGKEFKEFIIKNKEKFDNFEKLEKEIESLNKFYKEVEDFIVLKVLKLNTSVNIENIKGTDHLKYIGMSYLDMLEAGLKMDINIPLLIENPIYYYEDTPKNPTIYYASFNTKDGEIIFVDGDGNHRTALAKIINALDKNYKEIKGITKKEYKIDYQLMERYLYLKEELNKLGFTLSISKEEISLKEDKENHIVKWRYKHRFEIRGKGKYLEFNSLDEIDISSFLPFYKKILYQLRILK